MWFPIPVSKNKECFCEVNAWVVIYMCNYPPQRIKMCFFPIKATKLSIFAN